MGYCEGCIVKPALPPNTLVASTFFCRLLGLGHPLARGRPVFFPRCRWVHGFGLSAPVRVCFYDAHGDLLVRRVLRPWQWLYCSGASSCLESFLPKPRGRKKAAPLGAGLVEALLVLPVVLLLGLAVLQLGQLIEARLLAERAADRGAQMGARSGGDTTRISNAMAQALAPALLPSGKESVQSLGAADALASRAKALLAFREQQLRLHIHWQTLGPDSADFADWASPLSGALEPTLPLSHGPPRQPRTGVAGYLGPWPVGAQSGRAEFEAKRVRLELTWAVPLRTPLAGPLLAKTLSVFMRCGVAAATPACLALRHPQGPRLLVRAQGAAQIHAPWPASTKP